MFFGNLCHAILNTLKHFTIFNLPYITAKKIEYGQNSNLFYRTLLLLYWYSTDNPTTLLIIHFKKKIGMHKHNSKD